jgi:hypothetical protein
MNLTCPRCHQPCVRRSHRKGVERWLLIFRLVPYRCMSCDRRFFWFRGKDELDSHAAH